MSRQQHPEAQILPTQPETYGAPVDSADYFFLSDDFNLHVEHIAVYGVEEGSDIAYQDMYSRHHAMLEKEQLGQVEFLSPSVQDSALPISNSSSGEVSLIESTVFRDIQAIPVSQVDLQDQLEDWPLLADGNLVPQLDSTIFKLEDLPSSEHSNVRDTVDSGHNDLISFSMSDAIPLSTRTYEAADVGENLPTATPMASPDSSEEFGTCLALHVADFRCGESYEEESFAADSKEGAKQQQQQQQQAVLHSIEEQLSLSKHTLDNMEELLQLNLVDKQHLLDQFAAVDFSQMLNGTCPDAAGRLHRSSSNGEDSFATSIRSDSTNPFSQAYLCKKSAESSFVDDNDIPLYVTSTNSLGILATNDSITSEPNAHISMPIASYEVAHTEPGEGDYTGYRRTCTTSIASKLKAIEANIVTLSGTFNMHLRKLDFFMWTYKQHKHIQRSWRPHVGNVYDHIRRYFLIPPSAAIGTGEIHAGQSNAPTSRIQTDHVRRIISDPAVGALDEDRLKGFHLMLLDQLCVRLIYAYLYNIQVQSVSNMSNRRDLEQKPFNPVYQEPLASDFASVIHTYTAALLYHSTRDATASQQFFQFGLTMCRLSRFLDYLGMLMVLHLEMRYFLGQYAENIVSRRIKTDVFEEPTVSTKLICDKFDEICRKWNVTKALLKNYRDYIGAQDFSQWYHMLLQLRNQ